MSKPGGCRDGDRARSGRDADRSPWPTSPALAGRISDRGCRVIDADARARARHDRRRPSRRGRSGSAVATAKVFRASAGRFRRSRRDSPPCRRHAEVAALDGEARRIDRYLSPCRSAYPAAATVSVVVEPKAMPCTSTVRGWSYRSSPGIDERLGPECRRHRRCTTAIAGRGHACRR